MGHQDCTATAVTVLIYVPISALSLDELEELSWHAGGYLLAHQSAPHILLLGQG